MDDTYFPDELWLDKEIQFTSPSPSAWKLTEKISENIGLLSKKEFEDYQATSSSIAVFECHRSSDPTQQAEVAIYMQIPNKGTQALPPNMRRRQASDEVPKSLQEELEPHERLAGHRIDFTPQLVGFKHEKQDVDGLVPDGFVSYMAYTKVPGVALGEDIYRYGDGSDIPDVNVASDARSTRKPGKRITRYHIPEGLFWTMRRIERDLIRAKFNVIYRKLLAARVRIHIPFLNNLFWDQNTQKLYIDGVFAPTDGTVTRRPLDVGVWGLAVHPNKPNLGLQDENDADFVAAGWIL